FIGIWGSRGSDVWVSTTTTVFHYSPLTGDVSEYAHPFGDASLAITDICGFVGESVWVASHGGGAAQFRLADDAIVSMRNWGGSAQGGLSANDIRDIAIDEDGSVWFATSIGVFRYQPWAFQAVDERPFAPP
ncbi:MAG TPA: hypothetical protein DCL15_16810, partial [Chloroflexi bacterium]|nr:hypothetical protein [Chloroflexota bacterium]